MGVDADPPARHTVRRAPAGLASDIGALDPWQAVTPLPPLRLAESGDPPRFGTCVRVAWDDAALYVRFDCEDECAWGTHRKRDAPLWEEEAVEVFLAPGKEAPRRYVEVEASPLGVVFDAVVDNPSSARAGMVVRSEWDLGGLRCEVGRGEERQDWWAALVLPWRGLLAATPVSLPPRLPRRWRANFYRIERPRAAAAEFSAWCPTLASPADFHRPERFGLLELGGSRRASRPPATRAPGA